MRTGLARQSTAGLIRRAPSTLLSAHPSQGQAGQGGIPVSRSDVLADAGGVQSQLDVPGVVLTEIGQNDVRKRTRRRQLCSCRHSRDAHRHYRPGSDCAFCDCPRWSLPRADRRILQQLLHPVLFRRPAGGRPAR